MSHEIIECTNLDSILIETPGPSSAISIPAVLVLAASVVMRDLGMDLDAVLHVLVEDTWNADGTERNGHRQWHAWLHGKVGRGMTPWAAILDLAEKLESSK